MLLFCRGAPYFHRHAGQNQFRHHIGVTYIAVREGSILGFLTVTSGQLDAEVVPGKRLPPYPVSVLRLARLATAESAQGQGIGRGLLRFCIELAERMQREVGCVGVVVDAKPGAVSFYQRYGFVNILLVEGMAEHRPAPQAMFLPLAAVPRDAR
jgi:GNAT superfamily N-acetyltransferase